MLEHYYLYTPYKRKRRRRNETASNIPAKGTQRDDTIAITDNDTGNKCEFSTPVPASNDSENHDPPSEDSLGSDREVSSESKSDSEEPIFDKIDQAYNFNANNIIEIRDSLFAPKDNIVIFVTQNEDGWDDDGSRLYLRT